MKVNTKLILWLDSTEISDTFQFAKEYYVLFAKSEEKKKQIKC